MQFLTVLSVFMLNICIVYVLAISSDLYVTLSHLALAYNVYDVYNNEK